MTLLLPCDELGLLGHCSLTLTAAGAAVASLAAAAAGGGSTRPQQAAAARAASGIACGQVLEAVRQHYSQALQPGEVAAAMAADPRLRRALQVAWQAMETVPRSRLLGPRVALEGLRRCSWEHGLAVYEARLSG